MGSCGFRNGIRGTPPVPSRFGADVCKFRFIFSLTPACSRPHALARTLLHALARTRTHTFFKKGPNLGGRLRIRVYYSTTTSSETTRQHTDDLKALFDKKGVSARADAEPWIPMDIDMAKAMRDKIFDKAGTRTLPLLFVVRTSSVGISI